MTEGLTTGSKTGSRKRMSGPARRSQIIKVALRLIAKHGVHGTTTARIASAAGITEATLYHYFRSRNEILMAALDAVYEKVFEIINSSQQSHVVERLREITQSHSALVSSDTRGFVYPLFEFVAAAPNTSLRRALEKKQIEAIEAMARIVREGQEQGSIIQNVDPEQVAWELVGVAWTEDIASLMGIGRFIYDGRAKRMVDLILDAVSAERTLSVFPKQEDTQAMNDPTM